MTPYVPSDAATATPTLRSTPTPTPTPKSQAELQVEAEAVYRAYVKEGLKLDELGGAAELPPAMTQYLMEPYQSVVAKAYREQLARGNRIDHTDRTVVKVLTGLDPGAQAGAVVAIQVCVDSSKALVTFKDGRTGGGSVVLRDLYFKRDATGALRIFYALPRAVASC